MSPQPIGRLQGRVAIITGSSGSLGRAIAQLFASEGAKCFCVDKYAYPRNPINPDTGKADDWNNRINPGNDDPPPTTKPSSPSEGEKKEETRDREGEEKDDSHLPTHLLLQKHFPSSSATFHQADLTSEPSVISTIKTCLSLHSRVDILINAHGISTESTHPTPLRCHSLPLTDYLLTQSINSTSVFLTCKHVLSQFLAQDVIYNDGATRGWIVNVSSIQGLTPYYNTTGYCASKGAVVMLSRQIALDYATDGVVCNVVCPGFLGTDMTRNLRGDKAGEGYKGVVGRQGLNVGGDGFGRVEDVARMVGVMAGDDARWMTGQAVVVDGGYMIS